MSGLATIMEPCSEKKKRGRPSTVDYSYVRAIFPGIAATRRGQANLSYQQRAIAHLSEMNEESVQLRWLFGGTCDEIMGGKSGKMRRTILQELGRIDDIDDLVETALEICKLKPNARHARALIRSQRGVHKESGNSDDLAAVLVKAMNGYLYDHPNTATDVIRDALATVYSMIGEDSE